jgi:hypothetical protein
MIPGTPPVLGTNSPSLQNLTNYLIPSAGGVNGVPVSGTLVNGDPVTLDWQNFASQDMPFQPQGVYIDNTAGTQELEIEVQAQGGGVIWTIYCAAGYVFHTPFPAPNGQVHVLNGAGPVNLVYVNFPPLPLYYEP